MILRASPATTDLLETAAQRFTGADNAAARRLYESMGAGLATQGPTVNYWFHLPPSAPAS
ncbi:hypothetical protein ACQP00_25850 [Dactylosporangium sp. CS-047395]|uniref:hypothetical protein n=1 Tax=Dactylosporangium sp. CS-047395 TaxID=3239936 RepID=UPI003D945377